MAGMNRSDKNKKLIAAIRRNEILWNTELDSFKDVEQKKLVWDRIAEDLNVDGE